MQPLTRSQRSTVKRLPDRGAYDRHTIDSILDEGLICHVGFIDGGSPFVIPTGYGRDADRLLIHGSSASRMVRALAAGADACVTVTLQDGIVLARSAFHHSMNYRSVVLLGRAELVEEGAGKLAALERITEHLVPGRWRDVRKPSTSELKATAVLAFRIDEASAKIRVGPPKDDEEDYDLPVWAGVIPLQQTAQPPETDDRCLPGAAVPPYALHYDRRLTRTPL